jgi:NAD(P)-dependent dehydrogenase (short-subunit alcohol dehydrogenase family)
MGTLAGKVVLISGGGTGIGAATARHFAVEGAAVVVTGRRQAPLTEVARECGGVAVAGDAADSADARRIVEAALRAHGRLDGVVAAAGSMVPGAAQETADDAWEAALRANLRTAFVLVREALPALIEARGAVVLLSSGAGTAAAPGLLGYVTAKHALTGLARSLAVDYGPRGVRCNAVCPGWVRTGMSTGTAELIGAERGKSTADAYAFAAAHLPLRRVAEPDEIAKVCAFLISDDSSIITGAVLPADSGASAIDPASLIGSTLVQAAEAMS